MTSPEIRVDHLTIIRPGEVHVDVMVQIKELDRDRTNALLDCIVAAGMLALNIEEHACTGAATGPQEQESGVCNHLDADDVGEVECICPEETCPYLDMPDVTCRVKTLLHERMTPKPQTSAGIVYETDPPEWVEPDDGALRTYTVAPERQPGRPKFTRGDRVRVTAELSTVRGQIGEVVWYREAPVQYCVRLDNWVGVRWIEESGLEAA